MHVLKLPEGWHEMDAVPSVPVGTLMSKFAYLDPGTPDANGNPLTFTAEQRDDWNARSRTGLMKDAMDRMAAELKEGEVVVATPPTFFFEIEGGEAIGELLIIECVFKAADGTLRSPPKSFARASMDDIGAEAWIRRMNAKNEKEGIGHRWAAS